METFAAPKSTEMALKRALVVWTICWQTSLSALSTNAAGQLDVLGHDCHSLGVNGAQVGVLEQTNKISFAGLLQSHNSRALETEIGLEILSGGEAPPASQREKSSMRDRSRVWIDPFWICCGPRLSTHS